MKDLSKWNQAVYNCLLWAKRKRTDGPTKRRGERLLFAGHFPVLGHDFFFQFLLLSLQVVQPFLHHSLFFVKLVFTRKRVLQQICILRDHVLQLQHQVAVVLFQTIVGRFCLGSTRKRSFLRRYKEGIGLRFPSILLTLTDKRTDGPTQEARTQRRTVARTLNESGKRVDLLLPR